MGFYTNFAPLRFHLPIRGEELKGNPVQIGSCPRNCKLKKGRYHIPLPLLCHHNGKAIPAEQARRPAEYYHYMNFRVKGWMC
jgi:hypothetical protein